MNAQGATICGSCGASLVVEPPTQTLAPTFGALPTGVQAAILGTAVAAGLLVLGAFAAWPWALVSPIAMAGAMIFLIMGIVAGVGAFLMRRPGQRWVPLAMLSFYGVVALGSLVGVAQNDLTTFPTLALALLAGFVLVTPDAWRHNWG